MHLTTYLCQNIFLPLDNGLFFASYKTSLQNTPTSMQVTNAADFSAQVTIVYISSPHA